MNAVDIAMAAINAELNRIRADNRSLTTSADELRLRLQTAQNELAGERIKTATAQKENSLNQSRLATVQEELKKANEGQQLLRALIFAAKEVLEESKAASHRKESKLKSILGQVKHPHIQTIRDRCQICGVR